MKRTKVNQKPGTRNQKLFKRARGSGKLKSEQRLRSGFSTGTAATAAARAALRHLLTGEPSRAIAVRLPMDYYIGVSVFESSLGSAAATASVKKDGGDDPDVTNGAEIRATVRLIAAPLAGSYHVYAEDGALRPVEKYPSGIQVTAGRGVGHATKPGLPVKVGEPAINPVPRYMLARNLTEELLLAGSIVPTSTGGRRDCQAQSGPCIFLSFHSADERLSGLILKVQIEVPEGLRLAQHTLNPRLGIEGGISILGTTGLVKPFSHEAYEDTIRAALKVAASNECATVVLSTGGKSEKLARKILPNLPAESFIQIADFFSFAVQEASNLGFKDLIHSLFFGKALKMAQGHAYTHAHRVAMDLGMLAALAERRGHGKELCRDLAAANTARHGLEILLDRGVNDVIRDVAQKALSESMRLSGKNISVRLLLFHHDGNLLADVRE